MNTSRLVPENDEVMNNTLLLRMHESREYARQDYIDFSTMKLESDEDRRINMYRILEAKELYERMSENLYQATKDKEYLKSIM